MVVGQFTQETSLAVIGGGAGGYTAALRAAELGVETVLVDANGACPHRWWLYSKTLSEVGRLMGLAEHSRQLGVEFGGPDLDLHKLQQWTRQMSETLTTQLQERCTQLGVEVIRGTASFENARQIMVHNGPRLRFKRAIIATGATPVPPPGGWGDSRRVTDWTGVGAAESLPARLLILGGGSRAVELADTYAALGCTVAIATSAERLLPDTDPDLVRPLESKLARTLDEISVATEVSAIDADAKKVQVDFKVDGATSRRTFDHVIVALGHRPNCDGLDLAKAQVELGEHDFVVVDEKLRTSNPRVLAVGDVTGPPLQANKAVAQGRIAAELVAGQDSVFEPRAVPSVVFTDPPIAWCGLTETEATARDISHRVSTIPWAASGRAVSLGQTDGMTKLVLEPGSNLVLGLGIVGAGAAEMIGEAALAIEMGAVAEDLAAVLHPHPSLGELISKAAQQAD